MENKYKIVNKYLFIYSCLILQSNAAKPFDNVISKPNYDSNIKSFNSSTKYYGSTSETYDSDSIFTTSESYATDNIEDIDTSNRIGNDFASTSSFIDLREAETKLRSRANLSSFNASTKTPLVTADKGLSTIKEGMNPLPSQKPIIRIADAKASLSSGSKLNSTDNLHKNKTNINRKFSPIDFMNNFPNLRTLNLTSDKVRTKKEIKRPCLYHYKYAKNSNSGFKGNDGFNYLSALGLRGYTAPTIQRLGILKSQHDINKELQNEKTNYKKYQIIIIIIVLVVIITTASIFIFYIKKE